MQHHDVEIVAHFNLVEEIAGSNDSGCFLSRMMKLPFIPHPGTDVLRLFFPHPKIESFVVSYLEYNDPTPDLIRIHTEPLEISYENWQKVLKKIKKSPWNFYRVAKLH